MAQKKADGPIMKFCKICQQHKNIDLFHKDKTAKDGHSSFCKQCAIQKSQEWYKSNKDRAAARSKEIYEKDKEKIKQKVREWCLKNPEKKFRNHRKWYENNKDIQAERNKSRYILKHDHINELARIRIRNYRKEPKFKVCDQISRGIGQSLFYGKNGRHWESLVGFNIEQLLAHLEAQFKNGMSWDNYGRGGWHIDHKIPIAAFNFTKPEDLDFKRCWALNNLQPLWETENIIKADRVATPFQPSLAIAV